MDEKEKFNLSKWQCEVMAKHPILCWLGITVIGGIIVAIFVWFLPPKPTHKIDYITDYQAQITLSNEGILPVTDVYNIVTGPIVTLTPSPSSSKDYFEIKQITDNKYKVWVKDLPSNQKVVLGAATGNVAVPIGIINVTKEK